MYHEFQSCGIGRITLHQPCEQTKYTEVTIRQFINSYELFQQIFPH